MIGEREIEVARRLFVEGWGGNHPDDPLQFMTEDCVMRDVVGHSEAMRGYDAIRAFWGASAGRLKVPPEDVF
ncbi:MAG: hypothetical protein IT304_10305, partial [Dehalococcoidia bacterium]|nr:hypothetical protein [Dehalococcoidia bacterium]